jgi:hypothetical protein
MQQLNKQYYVHVQCDQIFLTRRIRFGKTETNTKKKSNTRECERSSFLPMRRRMVRTRIASIVSQKPLVHLGNLVPLLRRWAHLHCSWTRASSARDRSSLHYVTNNPMTVHPSCVQAILCVNHPNSWSCQRVSDKQSGQDQRNDPHIEEELAHLAQAAVGR